MAVVFEAVARLGIVDWRFDRVIARRDDEFLFVEAVVSAGLIDRSPKVVVRTNVILFCDVDGVV